MRIDTSTPVVALACPHHGGLGIARSLGRLGIPVFNVEAARWAPGSFSRYCRGRFVWDITKARAENSVAYLLGVAQKIGRQCLLIPGTDSAACLVADHADELGAWYRFPAQDHKLVRSLCSKRQMLTLARQHNVATPATFSLETKVERSESMRRVELPVIVKGIRSQVRKYAGKTKWIVRTRAELLVLYDLIGESTVKDLIAQEYIPGSEDNVWMFTGYFDERSECLAGFTGRKLRQCPAYTGVASLGVCQKNEAVERAATRLLKAVGYRGVVDMDFRYDARDGEYKLLDVNPRIGSTFRLFESTEGLDVARALYLDLTGQPVPSAPPAYGRKWMVEDFDLVTSLRYFRDGYLRPGQWLKSLRGIQEASFFAWDDPLPVLLMLRADGAELLNRLKSHRRPVISFLNKQRVTD